MCEQKETCEWITIKGIQNENCTCPICKEKMKVEMVQRQYKPVNSIFPFDLSIEGYVCSQCDEIFYPQKSIRKIADTMNDFLHTPITAKPEEIQMYGYKNKQLI